MDEWLSDEDHIAFLEEMWGDACLSPGGADEVARIVDGVDLAGTISKTFRVPGVRADAAPAARLAPRSRSRTMAA
jgi:hypothetical protein